jgi:hypothetical protein
MSDGDHSDEMDEEIIEHGYGYMRVCAGMYGYVYEQFVMNQ